jgi:tRNA G18 (ribose-2'-O)-methylase SpoU
MKKLSMDELNRLSTDDYRKARKLPFVVILDNIRSQNNTGSVFRTADAFRAEAIYLCGITATPPHREIQKTALGATESVEWKYYAQTEIAVQELKQKGYSILAVEQTDASISLDNYKPDINAKYALIFGNEVKGVQQEIAELADICIEIPQKGTKHSLNISVSAGIVMWTFFQNMPIE